MKLIVGLGNPGDEYKYTRHNVGFLAIDKICEKLKITLNKEKFNGIYASIDDMIVAKPLTYMNKSGEFVQALAHFYKIDSGDILVIYDEKDFGLGQAAIKIGGSSAGHNGVQNILDNLKSNEFKRLRIGIGRNMKIQLKNYVLGHFSAKDMEVLEKVLEISADAAISFVYNDIQIVMDRFNINRKKK